MNDKKSENFFGVEQKEAFQKLGEANTLGIAEQSATPKKILEIQAECENMGNIESSTYVSAKPKRRKFSNSEKIAICEEAAKTPKGKIGELLRKTTAKRFIIRE